MSDQLTAAYIAAAVSIVGIGTNIIISTINRLLDGVETRKQNHINAIEKYYVPLILLIDELAHVLNQFEKATSKSCTTNALIEYLSDLEAVPTEGLNLINNIQKQILDLNQFFKNNPYQYYPDYPLKQLHDLIRTTIGMIASSNQQEVQGNDNYITQNLTKCLDLFHQRYLKKTIKMYTSNPWYLIFPESFIKKNNLD